jgi:hypothetical protein
MRERRETRKLEKENTRKGSDAERTRYKRK